jgi:hypothetical protein
MASSNRFEDVVDKLHNSMSARIDRISTNLRNEHPVGKKKLTQREQVVEYVKIRHDPAAWQAIVQKYGIKSAIKYRTTMEKAVQRIADKVTRETEQANEIPGVNVLGSTEDGDYS